MKIETIAKIKEYRKKGLNSKDIAKLTGYSFRTIQNVFRMPPPPAVAKSEVVELFKTGHYTKQELADRFSKSVSWISKAVATADRSSFAPSTLSSPKHYKLFEYMANEHKVILLTSDLIEIERICNGKE